MKASQAIEQLKQLIEAHGDLDLRYDGGYGEVEEISWIKSNALGDELSCFTVNF